MKRAHLVVNLCSHRRGVRADKDVQSTIPTTHSGPDPVLRASSFKARRPQ